MDLSVSRRCSRCGSSKPLSEFSPNGVVRGVQTYRSSCRLCNNKAVNQNYHLRKDGKGLGHWRVPIMDGKKKCPHCGETKPIAEFPRKTSGQPHAWCMKCHTELGRKNRLAKYGISTEDYDRLLVGQNGVCAICRHPQIPRKDGRPVRLAVDHDHTTGKVRGLLCVDCNRAIGQLGDDPLRLRAAADYIERFRS